MFALDKRSILRLSNKSPEEAVLSGAICVELKVVNTTNRGSKDDK